MAVATSPPRPANRATPSLRGVVLALFVASGAAGLIYQVVWSRELVLVFGNTTQAVATIVTAFMAGLGFGSLVGGRLADTSLRPLRLYGLIELAVAAMAALLPFAFSGLAEIYRGVWPSLVERPGQLAGVRFALALAAVAPATFLMGMTLPLLTRYLVRNLDEAGARLGELYAANTIGAMAGTLLAGFVLIELVGLHLTSYLAVALNLAAGLGALLLSRRWETSPRPGRRPPRAAGPAPGAARVPSPAAGRAGRDLRLRVRRARPGGALDPDAGRGHRLQHLHLHHHPGHLPARHRPRELPVPALLPARRASGWARSACAWPGSASSPRQRSCSAAGWSARSRSWSAPWSCSSRRRS